MNSGRIEGVGEYSVTPLLLGSLTIPAGTPMAGATLPVQAFVIGHPQGFVLFDTGLGDEYPAFDEVLAPTRQSLADTLARSKRPPADFVAVINCHLHYDHCGGNPAFPDTPTFIQRREYEARDGLNWYVGERVEFDGADLRVVDGEHEVLPGLRLVLTPGHTPGHQSLVIEDGDGPVVIAGQAAYTAAEFDDPEHAPARGLKTAWDAGAFLESVRYLKSLRPRRVYFSHDAKCWTR